MKYLDYINHFNQWLETNALPVSSQLMYYKLLHVFNRAGWPEDVGVDNLRLQMMVDAKAEKTAMRARDRLVEAGFITYKKGKKGYPNRYSLSKCTVKNYCINYRDCDSVSDSTNDSVSDRECDSISDSTNDSHNKTKTKIKTKSKTPLPPLPEFGPELQTAFSEWLAYKQEKRQAYKPMGLKSLATQVKKYADQYGETAVADLIRLCMSSNWQGIIWDKLEQQKKPNEGYQYDPGGDWEKWSL